MRRESDNNISGTNNNPHPSYVIPSSSVDSSLSHLNYYNSAGYGSGYQHNSKLINNLLFNIHSIIFRRKINNFPSFPELIVLISNLIN